MSSTITDVRRLSVIACTLRGRRVEVISSDDLREPVIIVDARTRLVLRWKLSPTERRDLDSVVTERYQPKGAT